MARMFSASIFALALTMAGSAVAQEAATTPVAPQWKYGTALGFTSPDGEFKMGAGDPG